MNRRKNTSRYILIMTAIVMVAALISMSGLTMIHTLPVEATRPIHNDNDNGDGNGNVNSATRESLPQNPGTNPTSGDGNDDSDITMTLHCSKCSNNKKRQHQTQYVDKS